MPFPRGKSFAAVAEPTYGPVTFLLRKRRCSLDRIPGRTRQNTPRNTLMPRSRNIRRCSAAGRSRISSRPPRKPTFRLFRRSYCRMRRLRALTATRSRTRLSPVRLTYTLTMGRTLLATLRWTPGGMTSRTLPASLRWTPGGTTSRTFPASLRWTPAGMTSRTFPASLRWTPGGATSRTFPASLRWTPAGMTSRTFPATVRRRPGGKRSLPLPAGRRTLSAVVG